MRNVGNIWMWILLKANGIIENMKAFLSFDNFSIKIQIIAMCAVLIFCSILITVIAVSNLDSIGTEIQAVTDKDIPLTKIVSDITINNLEQAVMLERLVLIGSNTSTQQQSQKFSQTLSAFNKYSKKVNSSIAEGSKLLNSTIANTSDELQKVEFQKLNKSLKAITKEHVTYEKHTEELIQQLKNGELEKAFSGLEKIEAEQQKMDFELRSLLNEIARFTKASTDAAYHHEQQAVFTLIVATIIALLIGILQASFIIGAITQGVKSAVRAAEYVASGDLSQKIEYSGNNEISRLLAALSQMQEKLKTMVNHMSDSSTELANSSNHIASVSQSSADSMSQQQSETEQVATAMNEMALTIQEVSRNASASAEAARVSNEEAGSGDSVVSHTIQSIQQLAEGVENASQVIHDLSADSENIGGVLSVIKSIAEQTNLLALNAAIEAARAGEQGRGFAVVADEVRVLAQRTQESTREIEEMIEKLQAGTQRAVKAMDSGREIAIVTVEEAGKAGDSINQIKQSVATISDMNAQIASAAEEQASVAEEMNRNITTVNEISIQNVSAADDLRSSTTDLESLAGGLKELISQFKTR